MYHLYYSLIYGHIRLQLQDIRHHTVITDLSIPVTCDFLCVCLLCRELKVIFFFKLAFCSVAQNSKALRTDLHAAYLPEDHPTSLSHGYGHFV